MPLARRAKPFDDSEWIFELKYDGFRALAYIQDGKTQLISRHNDEFKSFPVLSDAIGKELKGGAAIVDGEIVCLDKNGSATISITCCIGLASRTWSRSTCCGSTVRTCALRRSLTANSPTGRALYCDYVEGRGTELFRLICEQDLEGIVAKLKRTVTKAQGARRRG